MAGESKDEESSEIKIKQIDQALSRYYEQRNRNDYFNDGIGKFEEYCDGNGFDDEAVADELAADPEDCMLLDFDDEFPFDSNLKNDTNQKKNKFIFDTISECYNNPNAYNNQISPTFVVDKKHFFIPPQPNKRFADLKSDLFKYCEAILKNPSEDKVLINMLYISIVNIEQPYMHLLADLYARDKITYYLKREKIKQEYITKNNIKYPHTSSVIMKQLRLPEWMQLNNHSKTIANMSDKKKEYELLQSAIELYYYRIRPLFRGNVQFRIKENYKHICEYIEAAVQFVSNLANKQFSATATCPFQYDFCFAFNETEDASIVIKPAISQYDSDDDDSDSDDIDSDSDEKCVNVSDCFGNVKKRLCRAGCIYDANDEETKVPGQRLRIQFQKFETLIKTKRNFNDYPQQKRFICLLDRREPTDDNKTNEISQNSELIFFEPPSDCYQFPANKECVDLWYFNSSKTCIIPNLCGECFDSSKVCSKKICGYNQERFTSYDAEEKRSLKQEYDKILKEANKKKMGLDKILFTEAQGIKNDEEKKNKMQVINTDTMKNAMLLSFHVQNADEIRCYLYLGSVGIWRFLAEDLNTYLPQFFVQSDENKTYVNGDAIKKLIENVKEKLIDERFTAFYEKHRLDKGNSNVIEQHINQNIIDKSRQ